MTSAKRRKSETACRRLSGPALARELAPSCPADFEVSPATGFSSPRRGNPERCGRLRREKEDLGCNRRSRRRTWLAFFAACGVHFFIWYKDHWRLMFDILPNSRSRKRERPHHPNKETPYAYFA